VKKIKALAPHKFKPNPLPLTVIHHDRPACRSVILITRLSLRTTTGKLLNLSDCTSRAVNLPSPKTMQLPSTGIAGLATATPERMVAGARKAEIVRLKITEAGRRALAEAGR